MAKPTGTRGSTGRTLTMALAAFAVLCGLILMINSPTIGCSAKGNTMTRRQVIVHQVVVAMGHVEAIGRALASEDYGQAKSKVDNAKAALRELLGQLNATAEQTP